MRAQLRPFAPYISVFGLVVLAASPIVPRLIQQAGGTSPSWLAPFLAVVGAVLALAWLAIAPEEIGRLATRRQVRYGGNAVALVLALLFSLGALNFLATRWYGVWDLTTNKQFSISNQTLQVLNDLPQPVTLTALLGPTEQATADDLQRLIDQYQRRAAGKITYQRIDPQVDFAEALALAGRTDLGDAVPSRALVAESGERHAIVYSFDEQAVTEAIVKATRVSDKTVAFLSGHGEYDPNGGGESGRGYASAKQALEREGYTVTVQNLTAVTATLDADALVIAGPRRPYLPEEVTLLADYIERGGSALLMLDPDVETGLETLLLPWEIRPAGDVVLQTNALFGSASTSVAATGDNYQFHTITKDLTGLTTFLVGAQSLGVGTPITTSLVATKLIDVGEAGQTTVWGETDLEGLRQNQAQPDETDSQPPLTLGVAAEGGEESGRIVVFGTSSLAADSLLQQLPPGAVANFDLFLNAVNWLAADEALISIRPTEPDSRPIVAPQRPGLLLLLTAVLVPLVIFGIGFWIFWRRR